LEGGKGGGLGGGDSRFLDFLPQPASWPGTPFARNDSFVGSCGCSGVCGFRFGGAVEFFEQAGDEAVGAGGVWVGEFGEEGDGAVGGVEDGVFDDASLLCGGLGGEPGEVEGGDLEAVEEEAGAAGVELVGGEAVEDLADGLLDGGAVFGGGEGEGGGLVLALGEVDGGDGLAGVGAEVVEAEVLAGEAGAAAAVASGEDVAALEAAFGGVGHDWVPLPPGTFCKVFD